jgi:hypothetical protein
MIFNGPNGSARTYSIVNRAQVLHMPTYVVRLLGTSQRVVTISAPDPAAHLRGIFGLRTAYRIQVSNTTSSPLAFDISLGDVALVIPQVPHSENAFIVKQMAQSDLAHWPWIAENGPLSGHATETGWVSFMTPIHQRALVNDGDLWFFQPGDSVRGYIGDIRLWK